MLENETHTNAKLLIVMNKYIENLSKLQTSKLLKRSLLRFTWNGIWSCGLCSGLSVDTAVIVAVSCWSWSAGSGVHLVGRGTSVWVVLSN